MAVIGAGVSLRGIYFEAFQLPFNLASGITKADEGKAVALDSTAANTVKLAGADEAIIGRLEVVEDRNIEGVLVGTVAVKFADRLPKASGATINVGDTVVGNGAGEVKAAAAADPTANQVVQVETDHVVVLKA